jgi:glycerophosphoryl diester phosphodiesterase
LNILAHRGYWISSVEKNSIISFKRAFENTFGIETDVRDYKGKLVISHDPQINEKPILFLEDLLDLYMSSYRDLPLAINIKADGLQNALKDLLSSRSTENYFLFDMSIPEMWVCLKKEMNVYTRQSEFEKEPVFYEKAAGIWMDCFTTMWFNSDDIRKHLFNGKKVAIISPEIHGRDQNELWRMLKTCFDKKENIFLCTDLPMQAREFFYGKN